MCDITLIAGDLEIPAHRMILAATSPYFYAMFTSFEEKDQARVKIQGVEGKTHSSLCPKYSSESLLFRTAHSVEI